MTATGLIFIGVSDDEPFFTIDAEVTHMRIGPVEVSSITINAEIFRRTALHSTDRSYRVKGSISGTATASVGGDNSDKPSALLGAGGVAVGGTATFTFDTSKQGAALQAVTNTVVEIGEGRPGVPLMKADIYAQLNNIGHCTEEGNVIGGTVTFTFGPLPPLVTVFSGTHHCGVSPKLDLALKETVKPRNPACARLLAGP